MSETEEILTAIMQKLEKAEGRSGYDYGEMDAESAYRTALWAMWNAIDEALHEYKRKAESSL